MATRGTIFVDALWSHSYGKEGISLQIEALRPIRF